MDQTGVEPVCPRFVNSLRRCALLVQRADSAALLSLAPILSGPLHSCLFDPVRGDYGEAVSPFPSYLIPRVSGPP